MMNEVEVKQGLFYIHKSDHRDSSPRKSQWRISELEERNSFVLMYDAPWHTNYRGWSLHIKGKAAHYLGINALKNRNLIIAKFIDGNQNNIWHGYPADYVQDHRECPSIEILTAWKEKGHFSRAKIRKIIRGQPCSL
jgi:hypothetical protein